MTPEVHISESTLPDGSQQVSYAVQTLSGVFEKRFNLLPETLGDADALKRAHAFFRKEILADIRRLRDQLNGWEI